MKNEKKTYWILIIGMLMQLAAATATTGTSRPINGFIFYSLNKRKQKYQDIVPLWCLMGIHFKPLWVDLILRP